MEESKREIRNAYSRGYNAGISRCWPGHKPPAPPDPIAAKLMRTALALRDAVDGLLATIDPDDPWETALAPKIAAFDAAMEAVSRWLAKSSEEAT